MVNTLIYIFGYTVTVFIGVMRISVKLLCDSDLRRIELNICVRSFALIFKSVCRHRTRVPIDRSKRPSGIRRKLGAPDNGHLLIMDKHGIIYETLSVA